MKMSEVSKLDNVGKIPIALLVAYVYKEIHNLVSMIILK